MASYTVFTPANEGKITSFPVKQTKVDLQNLCFFYGKVICAAASAPGDDETAWIYTVPAQKTFILLTASLALGNGTASRQASWMAISESNQAIDSIANRVFLVVSTQPNTPNSATVSPVIPLILRSGDRIGIFNEDVSATTTGAIFGYEIDSSLFFSLQ